MTGLALTIFSHSDLAAGDHKICILTSETGYFELERQAQRRGKTVERYLYGKWRMPSQRRASMSRPVIFMDGRAPDAFDPGKRDTLQ